MDEEWNTRTFFESATAFDVRRSLELGADIKARNEQGLTPLHNAACSTDHSEVIKSLLRSGADIDARDNDFGRTPLHLAAQDSGHSGVIKTLLNAGADCGARDGSGSTPLHLAAAGSRSPDAVETLLGAGANPNALDENGHSPLHEAIVKSDNPETVRALLGAGANPDARVEYGRTLLHEAARLSAPDLIEALLDAGADPKAKDRFGNIPWDYAKVRGQTEEREHLKVDDVCWRRLNPFFEAALAGSADINSRDGDGMTLLCRAALCGTPAVIRSLLDAGADPHVKDSTGYYPSEYAIERYDLPRQDIDRRLFHGPHV